MNKPPAILFRLSIARKMVLGYLPLAILIAVTAVFTLSQLRRLNRINTGIVQTDGALIEAADGLSESLLAQEIYGRRFLILKSTELLELFRGKGEDSRRLVRQLASMDSANPVLERITLTHADYEEKFLAAAREVQFVGDVDKAAEEETRRLHGSLMALAGLITSEYRDRRDRRVRLAAEVSAKAIRGVLILCIAGLALGSAAAIFVTRAISGPIHELKLATNRMAEGEFERVPSIRNRDEVGDLARAFAQMARELKRLEQVSLDASPLTRLPGGTAIEGVLKRRLVSGNPVAFCLVDLDNFKAFNDRYGYPAGSEVLKAVARLVEAAVAEHGSGGEFVGHVGGDDFVIVTTPDRYEAICRAMIRDFDAAVPEYYAEEDRRRGFIVGKSRQGQTVNFPIMTVSIAVVTNEWHELTSHLQVGQIAAELKDYAKTLPGSVFVTDRRTEGGNGASAPPSPGRGALLREDRDRDPKTT